MLTVLSYAALIIHRMADIQATKGGCTGQTDRQLSFSSLCFGPVIPRQAEKHLSGHHEGSRFRTSSNRAHFPSRSLAI
jgi:hypothetical protein